MVDQGREGAGHLKESNLKSSLPENATIMGSRQARKSKGEMKISKKDREKSWQKEPTSEEESHPTEKKRERYHGALERGEKPSPL